jgi:ribosomal peptide maturation radical SAM protein 1
MKIKLISMPWQRFDSASPGVGVLAAFITAREPRVRAECRSEHIRVWARLKETYETISWLGNAAELLYLQHLYPEKADIAAREICDWIGKAKSASPADDGPDPPGALENQDFARALLVTRDHLAESAALLAKDSDLVGLTTTYAQLFSSLCLARALKQENPSLQIVLGGWAASVSGPSLLAEYPFIDFVVVGEGELRLLHLIRCLLEGKHDISPETGILARGSLSRGRFLPGNQEPRTTWEVSNLDELPIPDFDEYQESALANKVLPRLPIEGSRGCWWDRRAKTGDVFAACHFCGLNDRATRRDKSIARIVETLERLSSRYRNTRFHFTDNLLRSSGRRQLAKALRAAGRSYQFGLEIRADIDAITLLDLKEAGCASVQIGVEGLSTAYLKRLNKGTTAIRNLYVMRACYELEIPSVSNLIVGFPGATASEVEETRRTILQAAIVYAPLHPVVFCLDPHSAVFAQPGRFGVKNVRMNKHFQKCLPAEVGSRLTLPWFDFDVDGEPADWKPVQEACQTWNALHRRIKEQPAAFGIAKTLCYFDGGEFLELIDCRDGIKRLILTSRQRDVYLYCMEIRSRRQIAEQFQDQVTEEDLLKKILEPLVAKGAMFKESDQYLSLAVAPRPDEAIRRLRAQKHMATHTEQTVCP